jgi:hypothetical protein
MLKNTFRGHARERGHPKNTVQTPTVRTLAILDLMMLPAITSSISIQANQASGRLPEWLRRK